MVVVTLLWISVHTLTPPRSPPVRCGEVRSLCELHRRAAASCCSVSCCLGEETVATIELVTETASAAARAAGALMRARIGAEVIETKAGFADLLTEVDGECQAVIERIVRSRHPTHRFLGEEQVAPGAAAAAAALGELADAAWLWLVDPIDGTTNFASGLPLSAVSIGVAHAGELVAGVVYDPFRDELFAGRVGAQTTLNGAPVHVSNAAGLAEVVLAAGCPPNPRSLAPSLRGICQLAPHVRTVRLLGSAAVMMAWVSCGRLTAYFEPDLNAWDTAAGAVLVRGAGGCVSGLDGANFSVTTRTLLCSNGLTHAALLERLAAANAVSLD
eukprot:CAMPEP_0119398502 /NCGR_PEP_ID=MMETSP1334-20130426/140878_1 /TAXON_ID=127549 /ORGANISM="Calcidiscus leptoporus, Strain RCC1130" /LENGTH=328 /DNA_ID=CAMNT_0007422367 /DNA_START=37 /DNA_END=1023 /DNA_ORIENTATION=-